MNSPTGPSLSDRARAVHVTTDGLNSQVLIDGVDLSSQLRGFTLEHRYAEAPLFVLYTRPGADTTFQGFAHVVVGDAPDPGPAIADFLRSVDAAALSSAALERDDLDGSRHELTRAMLAQLTDWALGKASG